VGEGYVTEILTNVGLKPTSNDTYILIFYGYFTSYLILSHFSLNVHIITLSVSLHSPCWYILNRMMTGFWDNASCSLVEIDSRFTGAYCLHHQGDE
jgi:hypothetical protein